MVTKDFEFEWDLWNATKSYNKHGVSQREAESAFYDEKKKIVKDPKYTVRDELRWILYGKSFESRVLIVAFTYRQEKIRIITARSGSKKEREFYEVQET